MNDSESQKSTLEQLNFVRKSNLLRKSKKCARCERKVIWTWDYNGETLCGRCYVIEWNREENAA